MKLANVESRGPGLDSIREKCAHIETRLRRQMVVNPKRIWIAGTPSLTKSTMHVHPAPNGTHFYLSLAVASFSIGWLSNRWWKQRKLKPVEN